MCGKYGISLIKSSGKRKKARYAGRESAAYTAGNRVVPRREFVPCMNIPESGYSCRGFSMSEAFSGQR